MYSELWHVKLGKHHLSGMRKPTVSADIIDLKNHHVVAVISLLSDTENHQLYDENDIPFLWLPMTGGTPPTQSALHDADKFIKATLQEQPSQASIAIHCNGGNKRTGTLIAGLLVLSGVTPEDAIRQVTTANPKTVSMNPAQLAFIKQAASN